MGAREQPMTILETDRLVLRELTTDDAPFILALVNDPAWIRFIGDKGVRTLDDARSYILAGPVALYRRHRFGLWLVEAKQQGAIGMCGLIRRDTLDHVDIGFAFLPAYRGLGYAREAAAATLAYGRQVIGLDRIVAIADPDNASSIGLLERIGLAFERKIRLVPDGPELSLFGLTF